MEEPFSEVPSFSSVRWDQSDTCSLSYKQSYLPVMWEGYMGFPWVYARLASLDWLFDLPFVLWPASFLLIFSETYQLFSVCLTNFGFWQDAGKKNAPDFQRKYQLPKLFPALKQLLAGHNNGRLGEKGDWPDPRSPPCHPSPSSQSIWYRVLRSAFFIPIQALERVREWTGLSA